MNGVWHPSGRANEDENSLATATSPSHFTVPQHTSAAGNRYESTTHNTLLHYNPGRPDEDGSHVHPFTLPQTTAPYVPQELPVYPHVLPPDPLRIPLSEPVWVSSLGPNTRTIPIHGGSLPFVPPTCPGPLSVATTVTDTNVPSQSMVRRVEYAKPDDWEQYREVICAMYEKKTLPEVARIMADEHGFKATEAMYKKRFKKWGLDKNSKIADSRSTVSTTKVQKPSKSARTASSVSTIRNRNEGHEKAREYWKARGVDIDKILAEKTKSTASKQIVRSTRPAPIPVELIMPRDHAVAEEFLYWCDIYVTTSLDAGIWSSDTHISNLRNVTNPDRTLIWQLNGAFVGQTQAALNLLASTSGSKQQRRQRYAEAGRLLVSSTQSLKEIVTLKEPCTLSVLWYVFMRFCFHGQADVALSILRQFISLSEIVLQPEDPLRRLFGRIKLIPRHQVLQAFRVAYPRVGDSFASRLGCWHRTVRGYRRFGARSENLMVKGYGEKIFIVSDSEPEPEPEPKPQLQVPTDEDIHHHAPQQQPSPPASNESSPGTSTGGEVDATVYGERQPQQKKKPDPGEAQVLMNIACLAWDEGRLADAEAVVRQLVARPAEEIESYDRADAFSVLANIVYANGKKEEAAAHMVTAVEIDTRFHSQESWMMKWFHQAEAWLEEIGRMDEVARLRGMRSRVWNSPYRMQTQVTPESDR